MPGLPSNAMYRITVNGSVSVSPAGLDWVDQYPESRWKAIADASDNHSMTATLERRYSFPDTPENRGLFPDATKLPASRYRPAMLLTRPDVIARIESR